MITSVIFGAGGQDGRFLKDLLIGCGHKVVCFEGPSSKNGINVGNYKEIFGAIKNIKPVYVFHLAAKSSTSHEALLDNQEAIVNGTANILEAVNRSTPSTKVFIASSGLIFSNDGSPICENTPIEASSAYALTRIESLEISRYFRNRGLKVYVGFLFPHESPYRPLSSYIWQVILSVSNVKKSKSNKIILGNPDTIKEWNWAGDIVNAILMFVQQNEIFEVVIGSGIGYSGREFTEICLRNAGVDLNCKVEITGANDYCADYHSLISDPMLIKSIGWKPKVGIEELSRIMMEALRND